MVRLGGFDVDISVAVAQFARRREEDRIDRVGILFLSFFLSLLMMIFRMNSRIGRGVGPR